MPWNRRRNGSLGGSQRSTRPRMRVRMPAVIEWLETRQLLNAAPMGTADDYLLPNSGTIVVGTAVGSLAADHSIPDSNDFVREEAISVSSGQQQHPGFLTLGGSPDSYGEITVTNSGSSL